MGNGVLVFDEVSLIRHRISNLLQGYNFQIYEAGYEVELFNFLSLEEIEINLIIMDISYDLNKGFDILSKIKEKKPEIPVFILTANNKRETFIRGIAEGASDYILKPFDDTFLLNKILALMNKRKQETILQKNLKSEIVFDIQNYLNIELKKAKKGKYEIAVLMCTFFVAVKEFNAEIENRYIQVSELFYQNFKSSLWGTDIFEHYGSQTFIGLFPYCGLDNMDKIKNKIKDSFELVIQENKGLSAFQLAISTITYPSEAPDTKELLLTLGNRMKTEIKNMKNQEVV